MKTHLTRLRLLSIGLATAASALAQTTFTFNTGGPNGQIAMGAGGVNSVETADDFVTTEAHTFITDATFTGLLVGTNLSQITAMDVSLYRVFSLDSDTGRIPQVPTRTNSPADVEFDSRSVAASDLTFQSTILNNSFAAQNSVFVGINKTPNQTTGGEGSVTGIEVLFSVHFATPFDLTAGHYFFAPTVTTAGSGRFYWLSSARPITGAGTTPFVPDLQTWIRNDPLDPDWLRVGTDIIGGATPPTYNASFSLSGYSVSAPIGAVPEPSTMGALSAAVLLGLGVLRNVRRRQR